MFVGEGAIGDTGRKLAHNNMPPFAAIHLIIATEDMYPSRP